MNRRSIPGYYFDEEKKKYFKIQANHLLPPGSKYSKGNVKVEQRQEKKRKVERAKQIDREKHTVKRNEMLKHPLAGDIGLLREHGSQTVSQLRARADAALVSEWRPRVSDVIFGYGEQGPLLEARFLPHAKRMVIVPAFSDHALSFLTACHWDPEIRNIVRVARESAFARISGRLSWLLVHTHNHVSRVVASNDYHRFVYMVSIPETDGRATESDAVQIRLDLSRPRRVDIAQGQPFKSGLSASMHETTGVVAAASPEMLWTLDPYGNVSNSLECETLAQQPAIDWLSHNIVAFESSVDYGQSNAVCLWDTRTRDAWSTRFHIGSKPITGIFNPFAKSASLGGQNLLVSTNFQIGLFDTRMPTARLGLDNPVMLFHHTHGGPKLDCAADGLSLVSAIDRDNIVQVYSLRNGTRVASLKKPTARRMLTRPNDMLRKLSWYEDELHGSTLQAIRDNEVVTWAWGEVGDEDG